MNEAREDELGDESGDGFGDDFESALLNDGWTLLPFEPADDSSPAEDRLRAWADAHAARIARMLDRWAQFWSPVPPELWSPVPPGLHSEPSARSAPQHQSAIAQTLMVAQTLTVVQAFTLESDKARAFASMTGPRALASGHAKGPRTRIAGMLLSGSVAGKAPGLRGFEGGELVLSEHRPRRQSRAIVVPLQLGQLALIVRGDRPVPVKDGWSWARTSDAIAPVRQGTRRSLEFEFAFGTSPDPSGSAYTAGSDQR